MFEILGALKQVIAAVLSQPKILESLRSPIRYIGYGVAVTVPFVGLAFALSLVFPNGTIVAFWGKSPNAVHQAPGDTVPVPAQYQRCFNEFPEGTEQNDCVVKASRVVSVNCKCSNIPESKTSTEFRNKIPYRVR